MEYIKSSTTVAPVSAPLVMGKLDPTTDSRQWGAEPDTVYWDWDDVFDEPEETES